MKTKVIVIVLLLNAAVGHSQGTFLFYNLSAPTRVGSADGPLAGPGIWAQMLVGPTIGDLSPVDVSLQHGSGGLVGGGRVVTVASIPPATTAYIQMVVWDGRYWGMELANVPAWQLGRTDIVPHVLSGYPPSYPVFAPNFTQPAVVPPIPEPEAWLLGLLGGVLAALWKRCRRFGSLK